MWSLPKDPSASTLPKRGYILQAQKAFSESGRPTPDLFFVEYRQEKNDSVGIFAAASDSAMNIHATTVDGRLLWQYRYEHPLTTRTWDDGRLDPFTGDLRYFRRGFVKHVAADYFGGALVVHTQKWAPWVGRSIRDYADSYIRRLDAETGAVTWEYLSPQSELSEVAIGRDGTVFVVESREDEARLIGLNGETGGVVTSIDPGHSSWGPGTTKIKEPSNVSTPIVLDDGTLILLVHRFDGTSVINDWTVASHDLRFLRVPQSGPPTFQDVQVGGVSKSDLIHFIDTVIDRLIPQPDGAFLASVPGGARLFKITPDSVLLPPLEIRSEVNDINYYPDEMELVQSDRLYALVRHQPTKYVPWNGAKLVSIDTDSMTITGSQLLVTADERVVPAPPDVHIDFALGDGGVSWGWDLGNVDQIFPGLSGGWQAESSGSETFVSPAAFVDVEVAEAVNPHPRPHISQQSDNQVRTAKLRIYIVPDPPDEDDIVRTRLLEIRDKLVAEAAGPNPTCSAWLRNPVQATRTWDTFLPAIIDGHLYARGHFKWDNGRTEPWDAQFVGAATGNNTGEPDGGVPVGKILAVNVDGPFFRATALGGGSFLDDGKGSYGGNNPRAQAEILLHELAHSIVQWNLMPPSMRDISFSDDLAEEGGEPGQVHNRKLLNSKCGALIRKFSH